MPAFPVSQALGEYEVNEEKKMRLAVIISLTVLVFAINDRILFAAGSASEAIEKEWASTREKGDLVSLKKFLSKYPQSEHADIARRDLSDIDFTVNKDGSILVTRGFDYHDDIVLSTAATIEIAKSVPGILFSKSGPPFIPRCSQAKEDREQKTDFGPIPDAVGTKWKFSGSENLAVICSKNKSIFLFGATSTNATIEFMKSGVLLKEMEIFRIDKR